MRIIYYGVLVLCAVMFGTQFFFTKMFKDAYGNDFKATCVSSVGGAVVGIVLLSIINGFSFGYTNFSLIMAIIVSVNGKLFTFCSLKALGKINISLYSVFSMLGGMALPFIAGIFFFNEPLTLGKIICFVFIALAILATMEKGDKNKGTIYYTGIFIFNGMSGVLSKMYTSMPFEKVTAFPVYAPVPEDCNRASHVADNSAIITTLNDDGSVFKFTGCAGFGAHSNSYRVCGKKGQIENIRGTDGKIMLRYNEWDVPDGMEQTNYYTPEFDDKDTELIKKAGHGGGDFIVAREFLNCIRENKPHPFDVYFSTTMASVAILGHRSVLNGGMPYDIPDFSKEEDRIKYENDTETPYWGADGSAPTTPCCSNPDYEPSELQKKNFRNVLGLE